SLLVALAGDCDHRGDRRYPVCLTGACQICLSGSPQRGGTLSEVGVCSIHSVCLRLDERAMLRAFANHIKLRQSMNLIFLATGRPSSATRSKDRNELGVERG